MDPVTGLSRWARRVLVAVVALGIAASTLATVGRAAPGCPEERYGCATSQPGEAVVLGVLVTGDVDAATDAVQTAIDARGGRFMGRRLRPYVWPASCDARSGAFGARKLASDPLDAPPPFAVIADACDAAVRPAAQIVSDSGIALVTTAPPPLLARNARTTLDGSDVEGGIEALAGMVLDAADELAVSYDGKVLIPRISLVPALRDRGLDPAPRR